MTPAVRFIVAIAAVVVVGAIATSQLITPGEDDPSRARGRAASPTVPAAPSTDAGAAELVIGRPYLEHHIVRAPARHGWEQVANALVRSGTERSSIGISAWRVRWAYADPCRWESTRIDFAGSVTPHHVARTLADQVGRDGADPVRAEIGGWMATRVELSVPHDLSVAACNDGRYVAFAHPDDLTGNDNHRPGQRDLVYVVNVDREPIVIDAWLAPGATVADQAELDAMLQALEIGFWEGE